MRWRRAELPNRRFLYWSAGVVVLIVLCAAGLVGAGRWLSPAAKRAIMRALKQQYRSDVEIRSLHLSFFPYPHATGDGLVFRQGGRTDVPPLIELAHFEARAGWLDLFRSPRRVTSVRLHGLQIHISHQDKTPDEGKKGPPPSFAIGDVTADGTLLEILPKTPGKEPLTFDIYKLALQSVNPDGPMHYRALLRNAKPPGLIHATGDFGPWDADDPSQTPVTGDYLFSDADLGAFKGLAGKLSSRGRFRGPLDRIEVSGETDTPDFTVRAGNHPVHLTTTFSATVDGTDGDTLLHPVTAHFGQTTVVAQGGVTGTPGVHGKTVSLDSTVEGGDLADVLRLGVKSDPPPMTGKISFHSKIRIPPGDQDIADKLYLNGKFDASGKFTSATLEEKVSSLSERARGDTDSHGTSTAGSDIRGRFVLDQGTITLSGMAFQVPGATIRLHGTYKLDGEKLDFHGTATTQAKLSEMTTGIKSFLLKALDPLFHKNNAGAVIPIHIGGTRADPSFGLDLRP